MSPLVIAWSMCAAMCLMLGMIHLFFWIREQNSYAYLLSSLMGFAAGASALLELTLLKTVSLYTYSEVLRWENLSIYMILVPMVWFIYYYFQTGRRWLAITITLMWSLGIIINFILPGSLTFKHIIELKQLTAFWGEPFSIPIGEINLWKWLADLATLLILLYTADASFQLWKQKHNQRTWIVGGSIMIFILSAGIHTPLVDAGLIATPYMVSFWFLAIVFALSFLVVMDAVKSESYKEELLQNRHSLEHLSRVNLLGEYTTMLAHELNQPLTAILSNAQAAHRYLTSGTAEKDELEAILDDIVRDDKRASEIILRLRGLLQNEKKVRQHFDLNIAVSEVVAILNRDFKEDNIHLVEEYAPDLLAVYAGRIEIQQVILNLLVNAAKALQEISKEKRTVYLRTRLSDNDVLVEIQDSGPGLSSEVQQTLFKQFVTDSKDGLGMGLIICYRIIEAYGGRIWAENLETGGARLSFSLPLEN